MNFSFFLISYFRQIKECVGVAFLKIYRVGCIVTVRGGQGIVMKKKPDGAFGAPLAVTMLGPGLGASIGAQMRYAIN